MTDIINRKANRLHRKSGWIAGVLAVLALFAVLLFGVRPHLAEQSAAKQHQKRAGDLLQSGDAAGAEHEWLAAIAESPADASLYSGLGDFYRKIGQSEVAAACYQRLRQLAPRFPHINCRLAVCAEDVRAHLEAYADAQQELKTDPDCPRALDLLALLDERSGNRKKSQEEAEKAYRAAPRDEQTATTYAQSFIPEDPDRAAAIIEKARKYQPPSWRLDYLLGWCYGHSSSDTDGASKALAVLRQAEALAPDQGLIHREICRLLLLRNQAQDAVREGALAIQYSPYSTGAYSQYYQSLMRAGRKAEAQKVFNRSKHLQTVLDQHSQFQERYKTSSGDPAVAHQLAMLDEQLGNISSAIVTVRSALAIHPANKQLQQDYKHLLSATSMLE